MGVQAATRARVEVVVRSFASGRVVGLVTTDRRGRWHWWSPHTQSNRAQRWLRLLLRSDRSVVFKRGGHADTLRQVLSLVASAKKVS